MRPEIFIARRLSPSEADGMPAPVGVRIGVAGVALAFVIMLLSIAIVSGFKREITRKVTGYESQISLNGRASADEEASSIGQLTTVNRTPELDSVIRAALGQQVTIASVTDLPVLLKTDSAFSALVVRAVDDTYDRHLITDNLVAGSFTHSDTAAATSIAISEPTARELQLSVGDRVYAHFFRDGNISTRRLRVAAIYNTHFDDYDRRFAFANSGLAQSVAKLPPSRPTSISINGLPDAADLQRASQEVESAIVFDALKRGVATSEIPSATNVRQTGAQYLNWLELLDTNVVVIIVLMAVVSGFTLISSLFILILERVAMIGLLKAIGATDRQIRSIFIWLAEKIVVRGLLIGNLIGLGIYFVQHTFHLIPLDAEAYYLSFVPMQLSVWAWLLLNVGVVVGAYLILVFPSHIISKMSPVDALRRDNPTDE